jgi:ATP-binding cassette subfamily B protein
MITKIQWRDWSQYFLPLLRPFRWQLGLAALAMAMAASLTVMAPWPLKVVIDRVLSQKPTRVPLLRGWLDNPALEPRHILYGACAATLLIAIGAGSLTYFYTRTMGGIGQRFVFALRRNLFAHMQRLSLSFHARQRTGDLTARLTSDIQAIQNIIANGIILLVSNGCLLAGMAMVMFWLNWQFALTALSVTPFLFWTVFRYTRRMRAATQAARAVVRHAPGRARQRPNPPRGGAWQW